MIDGSDFYNVMSAMVPMYVAMALAYAAVRWWKVFGADQCDGINRFVATFAVPLLFFQFIATNNPYKMNGLFIAGDTLQKVIVIVVLAAAAALVHRRHSVIAGASPFDWAITLFSLATLPNTLIIGVPLLGAMYGDSSGAAGLMGQVVLLQLIVWYTLLIFLYEFRGAWALIAERFPSTASSIASFTVEPDVVSLHNREPLDTDAQVLADDKLHITVRRSISSGTGPNLSNPSDADIHNVSSPESEEREFPATTGVGDEESGAASERAPGSQLPPARVMVKLIVVMVWRKLIRNPNTYTSLIGMVWSLVAFRWNLKLPTIIDNSITLLSRTCVGLAMFNLGLFMAMQPKLIPCGNRMALFSMAVRFIVGPVVAAVAAVVVGIRGDLLRIFVVQAALPLGTVSFVFANEYNIHPTIQSTSVIFGTLVSLPIDLIYYIVLELL